MVIQWKGRPVLLSEFGDVGFYKKMLGGSTELTPVRFGDHYGFWLHGAQHNVFFPGASPRLAGNTLIWVDGQATYRLEGKNLARADAIELALSLRSDTP
jgi:hypothetical protein